MGRLASGIYLPGLEGLRGGAILLVMMVHFSPLFSFGMCGVDLFFVLSGFLITGILWDSKEDSHYYRRFYMRRLLRIVPLYYTFLFLILCLLPLFCEPGEAVRSTALHQGWLWSFLANFWPSIHAVPHLFPHIWSLCVEEQFYLLWPPAVFLLSRRPLMGVCLGLVFLCLGQRCLFPDKISWIRMDGLAVGAFLALAAREEEGRELLDLLSDKLLKIFGAATLFLWAFAPFWPSVKFTCVSLFFGGLVGQAALGKMGNYSLLKLFGKYSYAIYLFHFPIFVFLEKSLLKEALLSWIPWKGAALCLYMAIFVAASLGASWASWHLYEKHFLKFRLSGSGRATVSRGRV